MRRQAADAAKSLAEKERENAVHNREAAAAALANTPSVPQALEDAYDLAAAVRTDPAGLSGLDAFRAARAVRVAPVMLESETQAAAAYNRESQAKMAKAPDMEAEMRSQAYTDDLMGRAFPELARAEA
jgi:hypothetical protein